MFASFTLSLSMSVAIERLFSLCPELSDALLLTQTGSNRLSHF